MMKYKGYTGQVAYDDEAKTFFGSVINLRRDLITFQGESVQELEESFKVAVDDYLEWVEECGEEPEKPCTVEEVSLQIPKKLYTKLASFAQDVGISLEKYVMESLQKDRL